MPLVSRALALLVGLTSVPVLLLVAALTYVENDPWWIVVLAAAVLFGPIPLLNRLRFEIELVDDELRYRVRPWHLRRRTVRLESITGVARLSRRPDPNPSLKRVNLGRGWVDWTDEEVRYVLGDGGIRISYDEGRALELWFPGVDELARELHDVRDDGWSYRESRRG